MTRTFLDSGVLIAAARGTGEVAQRALDILDDPERTFASSPFVQLEVLPKARYHGKTSESLFYEEFFRAVKHWAQPRKGLLVEALRLASVSGLSALDALHVAAALETGADELVTIEKPDKPIHRVRVLPVVTIQP